MILTCAGVGREEKPSPICQLVLRLAALAMSFVPTIALAAISAIGDVAPMYPGTDPWSIGAELQVGHFANGSLTVGGSSDVTSAGGTLGFDPGVEGTVVVTGAGTTWGNTDDVVLGVFGTGRLEVLAGARVENASASLGHLDGTGEVVVEGVGSEWINSSELIVANGGEATLTIGDHGRVVSGPTWIGLNSEATGSVVVDGLGSRWEISQSLTLGDVVDSGAATLTLTGLGSRVYVGAAAVLHGVQYPASETAVVVSELGGIAELAIYNGNTLTNSGSAYLGVGANETGEVTIAGAGSAWHNNGNVLVGIDGAATLTLDGGGTISAGGSLTVGPQGTLRGNGAVDGDTINSGTVSPGLSAGSLSMNGNYTQSASGRLQVELYGTEPGQFDMLPITGAASLGGELEVALGEEGGDPFVPQMGDTFTFLTSSLGVTGQFATADLPALAVGQMWQVRYTTNSTTLAVTLAGDYNDDGTIDAADYVVWRRVQGGTYDPRADGDTNGLVNAADYSVWRAGFGANAGAGSAAVSSEVAVPEPAVCPLLVAALSVLSMARRFGRSPPPDC